ncbi:MAG TPA: sensor domain-containing protein, partial [Streptosporangiaceae bacterium]|nr:sensor domain-containing protein [Streptosporangiaceae bacterium]
MFLLRDLVSPRTWLAMTQHLAGLIVGFVAIFVVTFGLGFGFGGIFFGLTGLLLLGLTLRLAHLFARAERARFAFLTGMRIPAWPAPGSAGRADFRWGIVPRWHMWREDATWSELGYAFLRLPVSAVAATASVTAWAFGLILLTLPAYGWAMPSGGPTFGTTVLHTRAEFTLSAVLGALLLLAAPQLTRGLAIADTALARQLLGPPQDLAARVTELEISRERVVDAAEAERRRIERDLHDGAQQRLVALA